MIKVMTNEDEEFYNYMGKMFGSRLVQKQTNDRIYDDDDKEWYINIEDENVVAFVSISRNVIKNLYATRDKYLEQLLKEIKKETLIKHSTVSVRYLDVYKKCGFKLEESPQYKNFVTIYMEKMD